VTSTKPKKGCNGRLSNFPAEKAAHPEFDELVGNLPGVQRAPLFFVHAHALGRDDEAGQLIGRIFSWDALVQICGLRSL